jgi:hypothetical protein
VEALLATDRLARAVWTAVDSLGGSCAAILTHLEVVAAGLRHSCRLSPAMDEARHLLRDITSLGQGGAEVAVVGHVDRATVGGTRGDRSE